MLLQAWRGCFPIPLRSEPLPTSVPFVTPQPDVWIKPPWLPKAILCTFKIAHFPQNTVCWKILLQKIPLPTVQAKAGSCLTQYSAHLPSGTQCPQPHLSTASSLPHPSTPLPTLFLVYCLWNPLVKPRCALNTLSSPWHLRAQHPPAQATEQAERLAWDTEFLPWASGMSLPLLPATAQAAMIWQAPTVTSHGAMNESRDSVCMCLFVPLCVGLAACPQGACVGRCLPLLRMECCGWVPIICPLWAEQGVGAGSGGCGRGPHREAAARTRC